MSESELIAYVERLLGLPWALGAQGPAAYDCWSLMRQVQRDVWGRALPEVTLPARTRADRVAAVLASHPERRLWRAAARPSHGGGVEMSSVRSPLHVGVWLALDGGVILHCAPGVGVSLDSKIKLEAQGWSRFRWYDWIGGGDGPEQPAAVAARAAA